MLKLLILMEHKFEIYFKFMRFINEKFNLLTHSDNEFILNKPSRRKQTHSGQNINWETNISITKTTLRGLFSFPQVTFHSFVWIIYLQLSERFLRSNAWKFLVKELDRWVNKEIKHFRCSQAVDAEKKGRDTTERNDQIFVAEKNVPTKSQSWRKNFIAKWAFLRERNPTVDSPETIYH